VGGKKKRQRPARGKEKEGNEEVISV